MSILHKGKKLTKETKRKISEKRKIKKKEKGCLKTPEKN